MASQAPSFIPGFLKLQRLQAHHDKILDRTLPKLKWHLVSRSGPHRAWPACTFIFLVLVWPGPSWGPLAMGAASWGPQVGRFGAKQAVPDHLCLCQDKEHMSTAIYTSCGFNDASLTA